MNTHENINCPCGNNKSYATCCGRFISQQVLPKTPEELMRSRYTAFVIDDMGYIKSTMKPPALERFSDTEMNVREKAKWLKLIVLKSSTQGTKGYVEFCAYYYENQQQHCLHELSEFKFEDGMWYYIDGQLQTNSPRLNLGRNEQCFCGSGKKYKKCCASLSKS